MTVRPIDPIGWIPDPVKCQIADGVFEFLRRLAEKVLNEEAAAKVAWLKSDGDYQQALNQGLTRASTCTVNEYAEPDKDPVTASSVGNTFW